MTKKKKLAAFLEKQMDVRRPGSYLFPPFSVMVKRTTTTGEERERATRARSYPA